MDSLGGIRSDHAHLFHRRSALDRMREEAGITLDSVSLRLGQSWPPRRPLSLRDQANQTADQVARSLLPPLVTLPDGQTLALSEHPHLARRTDDAPLQSVLAREPEALPVLDQVAATLQELYPGDTGTAGLKHFSTWKPGEGETLEQFGQTYSATLRAAARLKLDNQYGVNRLLDHVRSRYPPEERAGLIELVGRCQSLEVASELWEKVKARPDDREKVGRLLEHRDLSGALAHQALEVEGGLDLALAMASVRARPGLIHSALSSALKLDLRPEEQPLFRRLALWPHGGTGLEDLMETVRETPQAADTLERLVRLRASEKEVVKHALADLEALKAMRQGPDLLDRYLDFCAAHGPDDRSRFQAARLDDPVSHGRYSQRQARMTADESARLGALESREVEGYSLDERREVVDRLLADPTRKVFEVESHYRLVTSERRPEQSLAERVELAQMAGGSSAAFRLLDGAWPQHRELAEAMAHQKPEEVSFWHETRYPDESLDDSRLRYQRLLETLAQPGREYWVQTAHRQLSAAPRESYEALAQALASRVEETGTIVGALEDLSIAFRHRRPDEPVAESMQRFRDVKAAFSPPEQREALPWLRDHPKVTAAQLKAQATLLGSLERATETLGRPAGGIREEGGAISVGGVRLKRRS